MKHVTLLATLSQSCLHAVHTEADSQSTLSKTTADLLLYARLQVEDLCAAAERRRTRLTNSRAKLVQHQAGHRLSAHAAQPFQSLCIDQTRSEGRASESSQNPISASERKEKRLRNRLSGLRNIGAKSPRMGTSASMPMLSVDIDSPSLTTDVLQSQAPSAPKKEVSRRREGYLMVCSRPAPGASSEVGRAPWSKAWVVLASGQLLEYSDWRGGPLSKS